MLAIIDTSIPLSKGTNSIIELWRVGTFIETWYYCNNNAEDLMFCVIFCMEMHIYIFSAKWGSVKMILAICRLIDISNTVIFLCHDACSGFREGAFTGTAFLLHLDEMTLIYCIYM